jgi:hypothetical protein
VRVGAVADTPTLHRTPGIAHGPLPGSAAGAHALSSATASSSPAVGAGPRPTSACASVSASASASTCREEVESPGPHPVPFNPFMHSGALALAAILGRQHLGKSRRMFRDSAGRYSHLVSSVQAMVGDAPVGFSKPAFLSLKQHGLKVRVCVRASVCGVWRVCMRECVWRVACGECVLWAGAACCLSVLRQPVPAAVPSRVQLACPIPAWPEKDGTARVALACHCVTVSCACDTLLVERACTWSIGVVLIADLCVYR